MDLLQRRVIQVRSEFAAAAQSRGDFSEAERLYLLALKQAETFYGTLSPVAGHVLIGLHDLYEELGRDSEAKKIWERIRQILMAAYNKVLVSNDGGISVRLRKLLQQAQDQTNVK